MVRIDPVLAFIALSIVGFVTEFGKLSAGRKRLGFEFTKFGRPVPPIAKE